MSTRPRPSPDVKTLIDVASHWSHEDDWSVPSIYISQIEALAVALAAGDDPVALARHAKHVQRDCEVRLCAERIPFTIERDAAQRGVWTEVPDLQ